MRTPLPPLVLLPLCCIWAAFFPPALSGTAEKGGFTSEQVATLQSLEPVTREETAAPLFLMKYVGNYGFDEYLKSGSSCQQELNRFLEKRFPLGTGAAAASAGGDDCSCFLARNENGQLIYGRNLDLPGYHPGLLLWTAPPDGYASVSMVELSVLGYPLTPENHDLPADLPARARLLAAPYLPRDGMNEHGLAVATLNVPPTEPALRPAKITIGRWQVNRLLLDHARTVPEAIRLLEKYNVSLNDTGAHYFVADALGHSAVIEYRHGGAMVVTESKERWQVVTNFFVAGPGAGGRGA